MHNIKGPAFVTSVLDKFLGLYTEADPTSLPDGSSPLTINCDYDIANVHQRPGKQSIFNPGVISGGVQNAIVQLSSAQIKAAFTVPVTLIPAQGPNLMIVPLGWVVQYNFVSVPYPGGNPVVVLIAGPGSTIDVITNTQVLTTEGDIFAQTLTNLSQIDASFFNLSVPPAQVINQPLSLSTTHDLSALTGDGTATLNIQYLVIDTTTGAIVGGKGNGMHGSIANLTAAQIRNAHNVPIQLVPAPGVNKLIVPLSAVMWNHFVSTPYVAFPEPSIGFGAVEADILNTGILQFSADNFLLAHDAVEQNDASFYFLALPTSVVNQPLAWADLRDLAADPGDGTVTVFVQYMVIDVTDGSIVTGQGDFNSSFTGVSASALKNAFGTAVVLTPAPGPNLMIVPLVAVAQGNFVSTPYGPGNGGIPDPVVGVGDSVATMRSEQTIFLPTDLLTGTQNEFGQQDAQFYTQIPPGSVINQPMGLVEFSVDLNGSTGDGTLNVSVQNLVIDTTTGIIVSGAPVGPPPIPPVDFNYLKTFARTAGEVNTLALDNTGTMWQEDVINDEGQLLPIYSAIEPNTFAESATLDDREFIALSNLLNGTDIPYGYDGVNFDRLSQVGPGAAPTATTTVIGSAISTITQNPAVPLLTGSHDFLLVSDAPSDHGNFGTPATPGNVFTIVFRSATAVPTYIKPGSNIVLKGFPLINGNVVNNDPAGVIAPKYYTVTSVGQAIPGQDSYDAITFIVPFTTFFNVMTPAGCSIQATIATVTTAAQVPNLQVGSQFNIAGTGGGPPAGYDGSWLVTETPNASSLVVTATSLFNNVATYSFTLVTGTPPVPGEAVSITGALNGNGIFNVVNAIITSVTPGSFSLTLVAPNIPSSAEQASAIIFGTVFRFDPFVIVGNKTGGTLETSGLVAAGVRKVCFSFLTRSGYVTQPSPIVTFSVPQGASAIAIANLATGPANVIARIIHLTPAEGGQFYNIPQPVTVVGITGPIISGSTWVRDNTTTNVILSFADGVLVTATEIDVEGNNLFETAELGSSVAFIPFGARLFALGEQNKLTNLLNWSFDGGVGVVQSSAGAGGGIGVNATYPLGWTVDPTSGTGGSVITSPIFGNAYSILNQTGSTQAVFAMITQPAFEDEFQVPIIGASTTYSVRVTAAIVGAPTSGGLVVDLYSPKIGRALGTFTLNLASLTAKMAIFTGTMLTGTLAPVPNDLILRLYGTNILNGAQIVVDRIEVFPTEQPTLSTQLTGSYVNNFEAFDQITGVINASVQNQQAAKSAFTLYDNMYMVKSHSLISTQDNGTTEPQGWSTRVVSNVVGTTSIYGVDSGEDWALIAGQPGLYIFDGGQPIKISSEIQKLWNLINWQYGHTLWVKNDIVNQRVLIGVPLKTFTTVKGKPVQNPWLPAGVVPDNGNPTTPNMVIMLNYKQLNTGSELADRIGVHSSAFTGKLLATDTTRKWSLWSIQSPCAAFITRLDNTQELWFGNSQLTGKIYRLVEDLMEDDGVAINEIYDTYPFITPEQEEKLGIGAVQKTFVYMRINIQGIGELQIKVFPNTLDTPYANVLLPNLVLPASTDGDVELPVNEAGDRLFVQFQSNAVGAAFLLSKLAMTLRGNPWAPVRGRNI